MTCPKIASPSNFAIFGKSKNIKNIPPIGSDSKITAQTKVIKKCQAGASNDRSYATYRFKEIVEFLTSFLKSQKLKKNDKN